MYFVTCLLQLSASLLAGAGLFLLWRMVAGRNGVIFWLVTISVLLRAFAGQLLFWISYLHLPIARSAQAGDGLWFFALDGGYYMDRAFAAARGGIGTIVSLDRTGASVFYTQVLAFVALLFGVSPAVALLLNLASYLGTCAAALKLAPGPGHAATIAITAVSFSPSAFLWSLQPLKDVFFLFLVAAFIVCVDRWKKLVSATAVNQRQWGRISLLALSLLAILFGIAGIRWYFAVILIGGITLFFLVAILRGPQRFRLAASCAVLVPLLVAVFLAGAGPYVPDSLRRALTFRSWRSISAAPTALVNTVDESRHGFDVTPGATRIGAGSELAKLDQSPSDAASTDTRTPAQTATHSAPPAAGGSQAVHTTTVAPTHPASARSGPVVAAAPIPAPAKAPHSEQAKPANVGEPPGGQPINLPVSRTARLMTGAAALVLPRSIAESLGILDVRGGRGLWFFVEVDTLYFDLILVYALVTISRAVKRRRLGNPSFWFVAAVTLMIAIPLAYTVSNFGTLFRHRDMILLGLVLLPLTIVGGSTRAALAGQDGLSLPDESPVSVPS